jgi:hypothetical protein
VIKSILTAAAFSVLYVSMYPVLIGGFVVYVYPYWSPPLAVTYILVGILLQAWFCFGRDRPATGGTLVTQVGAGVLYAAASMVFSGGCYQS